MSGTAGGTVVLHVAPEGAEPGSVFGIVQEGDLVSVDVEGRRIDIRVEEAEIRRRLEERKATMDRGDVGSRGKLGERRRGYKALYEACVNQADEGCDFRFLTASGAVLRQRE